MAPVVLSLFDFSGNWSRPYREAGYEVRTVDLQYLEDVRLFEALPYPVRGILAAPPCTDFAISGARWWKDKTEKQLLDSLALVDASCRIVLMHQPEWWVIENPTGRLHKWLGEPKLTFDPSDYGDAYRKRTCLWGQFKIPEKAPVGVKPGRNNWINQWSPHEDRQNKRSATPLGFARAFFAANP